MRNRFILGAVVLALLCFLVGGIHSSYRAWEKKGASRPIPVQSEKIETQLNGVDLGEWEGGRKVWALKANRVTYDGERRKASLKDIEARFWEAGVLVSTAHSPRAFIDTTDRRVEMGGGISIVSKVEDASVKADGIDWSGGNQRLHATGDVFFHRGKNLVRCTELWADRSLRKVEMNGPVIMRFYMESP